MRHSVPISATLATVCLCGGGSILVTEAAASEVVRPVDPWSVLSKADRLEVVSIRPVFSSRAVSRAFHGYEELGRTTLSDAALKKRVLSTVADWITVTLLQEPSLCFVPRHAIHAIHATHGGVTVDVLICFECQRHEIRVSVDDSVSKHAQAAKPLLDGILSRALIPLASRKPMPPPLPTDKPRTLFDE